MSSNEGGDDDPSNEGKCAICLVSATQQCAGCKAVFYCGRDHQKQHWARHRFECRPVKTLEDPVQGRYMVATKNISRGDLIYTDSPLLLGPKMVPAGPVCLGCHQAASLSCLCPGCGWPLCSAACATAKQHKAECDAMSKAGHKASFGNEVDRPLAEYACIVPLRYLLMSDEKKAQVRKLLSHLDKRINTQLYGVLKHNVVGFLQNVIGVEASEEDILGVCGVMDTNAYEVRRAGGTKLRGLYPFAAIMNHDCVPNTRHVFDKDDKMLVFATVDIGKGTPVTSTYTQALWSTPQRRAHLRTTKCFECACARCRDPSELGTFLSAITCSKCKKGRVVSTAPLDEAAPWRCDSCDQLMQAKQINWGNQALQKELEQLDKNSPQQLEAFLDKYNSLLHPTNGHALQAKLALTQIYGNAPGYLLQNLNDEQVERKLSLTHDLMDAVSILEPGRSRTRALLQLELQAAMALQAKIDFETERITRERAEEILGDAVGLLKEATEVLKTEPDMEGKLQDKLMTLMEQLELDNGPDEINQTTQGNVQQQQEEAMPIIDEEPVIVKPRTPFRR